MSIEEIRKHNEHFNALPNDKERWRWVIDNQDLGFTVLLDNDDTHFVLPGDEDAVYLFQFDWYIGNSDGVFDLLEVVGIRVDGV